MYNNKRQNARSDWLKFYLVAFVAIALMLTYVAMQMYVLSLENRVRDVQDRNREITDKVVKLEMKTAELRRSNRIKKIAREKLGMKMPEGAPETLF